ncbi:tectonic-like complex member MKS1 isoform X2 [Halichondria panicea]|uniref:tectonic-like complex member MKS1 isoform X2 n=1 Tax=Halichondria panicea TaxID=6063 RepID=UPI00312B4690
MEYLRSLFWRSGEAESDELSKAASGVMKKPNEEGMYYSRDSLKNLQFRVVLRKVTASGGGAGIIRETGRMSRAASTAGEQDNTDAWVFKWQEKVFSQHEDELYADANNCVNPLQLRYHREILQQRSEGCRPNGRLFSYVENDHYLLRSKETSRYRTFASKHANSVRKRHTKNTRGISKSVICDPILDRPSDDQRVGHRINTPSNQSMCLMADLRKQDGVDHMDEHLLCQITVDGHGRVTLCPDFTRDRPAVRIENRHKEVFEYRLENVSELISPEEQLKEDRVQRELYARHANYLKACVGDTFVSPPEEGSVRVCLHGEIVSGEGFDLDGLYVKAQLELPEGWQLEDNQPTSSTKLSVVSQISRTKSRHLCNVAHFGCPFDYHLIHTPTEEHLSRRPRLLLEVCSLDYWDRHRVEGYGYLDLPHTSGSHDLTLHTWRPAGRGVVDQLRLHFVGGAQQINDLSYVACPRDLQGDRLSRYGFQTESSGSVRVHLYIVQQSSLFVKASQESESNTSTVDTNLLSTEITVYVMLI